MRIPIVILRAKCWTRSRDIELQEKKEGVQTVEQYVG